MKQLFLAAAVIFSVAAHAQSDKYADAMKKNLALFDSAKTPADFENIAAGFLRYHHDSNPVRVCRYSRLPSRYGQRLPACSKAARPNRWQHTHQPSP